MLDRYEAVIRLAQTMSMLHEEHNHHGSHTARLARKLAEVVGMTSPTLDLVETGAHLHDLGKLLLPKELLNAPRKLEEEERAQINTHAALGWAMVQLAGFEPVICEIVRHHHERYDGNGYPDHLTAEQIPLGARLVAICDVFAALTHPRPYRAAYTRPFARKFLQAGKGQAFDPPLVDLFCEQVMP